MQPETRTVIAGKYVIEYEIDTGAMGRVFVATQRGLERRVALKIMNDSGAEYRRRFLVEAHSMARMNHRNVVTVYDAGETGEGLVFIVMELMKGRTLAEAFESERRFEVMRALHLITQIARGLRAAHREGIIHRDLKPSNIFLVDDPDEIEIVKVFDFGIAKSPALTPHHHDTSAGIIVGTPAYMAPEQIEGNAVDARTDLYALGVMLYLLLTGRTPFENPNAIELMLAHLKKPPPPPRSICATIPAGVDALVMRLLAKKPADRPTNVDELISALAEQMVDIGGEMYRPQITDTFARPFSPSASSPRTPPPAPFTGEHVNPYAVDPYGAQAHLRSREPLPRIDSPSPRTPAFILTPPRCASDAFAPDAAPAQRVHDSHDSRDVHKTRDRRMSTLALGAILLCASTAAVSSENTLWTAFVALQGAERAVAQDATPAIEDERTPWHANDPVAPVAPVASTQPSCVRGMCAGASIATPAAVAKKTVKRRLAKTKHVKTSGTGMNPPQ